MAWSERASEQGCLRQIFAFIRLSPSLYLSLSLSLIEGGTGDRGPVGCVARCWLRFPMLVALPDPARSTEDHPPESKPTQPVPRQQPPTPRSIVHWMETKLIKCEIYPHSLFLSPHPFLSPSLYLPLLFSLPPSLPPSLHPSFSFSLPNLSSLVASRTSADDLPFPFCRFDVTDGPRFGRLERLRGNGRWERTRRFYSRQVSE